MDIFRLKQVMSFVHSAPKYINDRPSHVHRKYAITLNEADEKPGVAGDELCRFFYENEPPSDQLIRKYLETFPEVNPDALVPAPFDCNAEQLEINKPFMRLLFLMKGRIRKYHLGKGIFCIFALLSSIALK
jgi:hypothetical protein